MSFREISAWLVLLALSWTGLKFGRPLWEARSLEVGGSEQMIAFVIGFVILLIVLHIIVGIVRRKSAEEEDERDESYELRAERVGSYALGAVAVGVLFYALRHEAVVYANIMFLGLVFSEIAKRVYQVFLYRTGA